MSDRQFAIFIVITLLGFAVASGTTYSTRLSYGSELSDSLLEHNYIRNDLRKQSKDLAIPYANQYDETATRKDRCSANKEIRDSLKETGADIEAWVEKNPDSAWQIATDRRNQKKAERMARRNKHALNC